MGLGWSAVTTACHVALILCIGFAFFNAVAVRRAWLRGAPVSTLLCLELPVFLVIGALVVERLYYISARLLQLEGHNLWAAHPAPELLSLTLATSVFYLACAIRKLEQRRTTKVRTSILLQAGTVAVSLVIVTGVLW